MGLVYRVHLPELGAADVVKRELSLSVGYENTVLSVDPALSYFDLPPVPKGASVSISLRGIDDAGNESDWSKPYRFSTRDTLHPRTPGAVRLELIDEVADPAPAPPQPEPEVVPEPEPEVPPEPTPEVLPETEV
jgi:hypothetical protein